MNKSIEQWQSDLEKHFFALSQKRSGTGFPIFALEHGLSDHEFERLRAGLLLAPKDKLHLSSHWLLWVVYATERGYYYTGDEYWQSFEEHTPGWDPDDRDLLPIWFRRFRDSYGGADPKGPWARHFNRIAWPITHAILPLVHQWQFVKALYDLRYRLIRLSDQEPKTIGHLLAAHVDLYASKRFKKFLEQEELTGTIALELLGESADDSQQRLHPNTLERIVADLEKVRQSRHWLKETRQYVRPHFKGIGSGSGPHPPRIPIHRESPEIKDLLCANVRPKLFLRDSPGGTWSIFMSIPDFSNLTDNINVLNHIRKTRCTLYGSNGTRPAGWLLSAGRTAKIKNWPAPEEPLIQFQESFGLVDNLVTDECRLSSGPIWLFRIGHCGIAREIVGHIVRPGWNYIIITTSMLSSSHLNIKPAVVDCGDVTAYEIYIPTEVSTEDIRRLKDIGLQVAQTIRVWPAGLTGRAWDGEGYSEWLTTESPCIGFSHDFPISEYRLSLNGNTLTIDAGNVGTPSFVKLASLPVGIHTLLVKAHTESVLPPSPESPDAEGFLVLNVREPERWTPGSFFHSGLVATLDPHDASLDTFWENRALVSIDGPQDHIVNCDISLWKADKKEKISTHQIGKALKLPISSDAWQSIFEKFLKQFSSCEDDVWQFHEAANGNFTIRAGDLGDYAFWLERDSRPIRWFVRKTSRKVVVRLIDDHGEDNDALECSCYGFDYPVRQQRLNIREAIKGLEVSPPGALYVASHSSFQDVVLIKAGVAGPGFQGLLVQSKLEEIQGNNVSISQTCKIFSLWYGARLKGALSRIQRDSVVKSFNAAIIKRLCGQTWSSAEQAFCAEPKSNQALDKLVTSVDKDNEFAYALRRNYPQLNPFTEETNSQYFELAKRFQICSKLNLCCFALLMANQPHRLPKKYGCNLDQLANQIRQNPSILRGARLLTLLWERCGPPRMEDN